MSEEMKTVDAIPSLLKLDCETGVVTMVEPDAQVPSESAVPAMIDRFHDPAVDCRHAEKEECDECNDCGAVLIPIPPITQLPPIPMIQLPEIPVWVHKLAEAEARVTGLTLSLNDAVHLKHEAEAEVKYYQKAMRDQALVLDDVMRQRDSACIELDARILDEQMREQRVDVEALRHKVREMKKNLATVDSRADERFVAQLRARDAEAETRIAAVRAEVQPTIDELDKVRSGEQARVEALNAALEMIWAFDKREPGCAYNSQNLIANLRQVLSAVRKAAQ